MSKKLKVVNLYGAPGVGKSGTRGGLFWLMKSLHMSVEEVSEYAKYLVLSQRRWQLREEQTYLFAKQHHKQLIIQRSGYEYAVTDSPLSLCPFFAPPGYYSSFESLVDEAMDSFENINFFLTRDLQEEGTYFETRGREQNKQEAIELETRLREFLDRKGIRYTEVPVNFETPFAILKHLCPDKLIEKEWQLRAMFDALK